MSRLCEFFSRTLLLLSGFAVAAMMVQIVIDVLLNNIAGRGIPVTIEYVSFYYMIAVVFLPLAAVEYRREYLVADLFTAATNSVLGKLQKLLHHGFSLTTYGILIYLTGRSAITAYHDGEIVLGARTILIWPARFILPVGLSVAFLVTLGTALQPLFNPLQCKASKT